MRTAPPVNRTSPWRSLCLACALLLPACGDPPGPEPIQIPAEHPCPHWALAPEVSSLWAQARDTGVPVPLALLPPLEEGVEISVVQGPDQEPSHTGLDRWSWDFGVPVGTQVRAAAPGVVVTVRDDSDAHGPDEAFASDANLVTLDHGGGLYTSYVHLALDSAQVQPGEEVAAGAPLASTGLSGKLTGPHLHFQVENIWSESLPALLVSRGPEGGCERRPDLGETVRRPPGIREHLVGATAISQAPEDTFAEDGILTLTGLPGRLMRRNQTYSLSGTASAGLKTAWLLILPVDGGDALQALSMTVSGGGFSGALSLGSLSPGTYGWAVVATGGEDPVVERSIRFSLTD